MRLIAYLLILLSGTVCCPLPAIAQFSSSGTEFLFAFIQNRTRADGQPTNTAGDVFFSAYVSNNDPARAAQVNIAFNGRPGAVRYRLNGADLSTVNNAAQFTVPGADVARIDILPASGPLYSPADLQVMGNNIVQRKSFSIQADTPVAVFAESWQLKSRDASLILPVSALGTEYYTISYLPSTFSENVNGGPNEFAIVALEDNTRIDFVLPQAVSSNVGGVVQNAPGGIYRPTLNKGECLQIQSDEIDLTGTRIRSLNAKPFAVFSGNMAAKIPLSSSGTWDHVYEQMLPVSTWGCSYITTPLRNESWDAFKIIAAQDGTRLAIDGQQLVTGAGPIMLQAGEFLELNGNTALFRGNPIINAPRQVQSPQHIEASAPINVAQFSVSSRVSPAIRLRDPMMIVLSPLAQAIDAISFTSMPAIFPAGSIQHSVNVVAPRGETADVFIHDYRSAPQPLQNLTTWQNVLGTQYAWAQLNLTTSFPGSAQYRLFMNKSGAKGFNAYAYGFDDLEGYGYAAGLNLIPMKITTPDTSICRAASLRLEAVGGTSYRWRPVQGLSCSTCPSPLLKPTTTSDYIVEIRNECIVRFDTIRVEVIEAPSLDLPAAVTICEGDSLQLLASPDAPNLRYRWSNGAAGNAITVKEAGLYKVWVSNDKACGDSAEVLVTVAPLPELRLDSAVLLCKGETLTLDPGNGPYTWRWSTGVESRTIDVAESGLYTVWATNDQGCVDSASSLVTVGERLALDLPPRLTICEGDSTLLEAGGSNLTYRWSTGASGPRIVVKEAGTYTVWAESPSGCRDSASSELILEARPELSITRSSSGTLCDGQTLTLSVDQVEAGVDYTWSNGSKGPTISVTTSGEYRLTATSAFGCSSTAIIAVEFKDLPAVPLRLTGPDRLCEADSLILSTAPGYEEYRWSNGARTPSIVVREAGAYQVEVIDSNGCRGAATIDIEAIDFGIDADRSSVTFAPRYIGQTGSESIRLTNLSDEPIRIAALALGGSGGTFALQSNQSLPLTVAVGATQDIALSFTPPYIGEYHDTLLVVIDAPCPWQLSAPLTGIGLTRIRVWLPDTTALIGQQISLPLRARVISDTDSSFSMPFSARIEFNEFLFSAEEEDNVFIKGSYTGGDRRSIEVGASLLNLNRDTSVLLSLSGTTLLGPDSQTTLALPAFTTPSPYVEVERIEGSLSLNNVCLHNSRLVGLVARSSLRVSPQPLEGRATIEVESAAAGSFVLRLYSLRGELLFEQSWRQARTSHNPEPSVFNLDTDAMPDGVYQLVLRGPLGVYTKTLLKRGR